MELPQHGKVDLEADAAGIQVEDTAISRLSSLAETMLDLESEMAKLEQLQKELSEKHRRVSEYDLPDAMTQAGVSEFKLKNGAKISVKPFYSGKINDENRAQAFSWLRDNELGDLIKHEVTVPIGRGNEENANRLLKLLSDNRFQFVDKEAVHHSTLNAQIKDWVERGIDFPMALFNAFVGRKAKIKL